MGTAEKKETIAQGILQYLTITKPKTAKGNEWQHEYIKNLQCADENSIFNESRRIFFFTNESDCLPTKVSGHQQDLLSS